MKMSVALRAVMQETSPPCRLPRWFSPAAAFWALLVGMLLLPTVAAVAQPGHEMQHRRGRIWETFQSDGLIGNAGAWDYLTSAPLGMYPGFNSWTHPRGGEQNAINTFANANYHNFHSGVWIMARDLNIPGQPPSFNPTPASYEFYASGAMGPTRGVANSASRDPIVLSTNYMEGEGFNPLLPEESTFVRWHTNTGITVSRRTYVWSYPGFSDFIIYDYTFTNTGEIVSMLAGETVSNPQDFQQTLREVYFAFHSAISVSTKSQINFYSDLLCVQAGAFGWQPPYHDFYHIEQDETLFFSTNYNGGKEPPPWNCGYIKDGEAWEQRFGPELQSPAAFGWKMLYADPVEGTERASVTPDVYRIDTFKGNPSRPQDLEFFQTTDATPQEYYNFATTATLREQLGNRGDRFNHYTMSYGPYTLAPGDSVRIVVAEVAGVMDYNEVIAGDPDGHFPDSTIADIKRNAENAQLAVEWGMGATVNGVALAADAPEPPPAPNADAVNASVGTDAAAIAVTWDDVAERTTFVDGSGATYFDGASDVDGYRIYRSRDFQYTSDTEDPVLRGAAWTLIADIPISETGSYWNEEIGRYSYTDDTVDFGRRYGYYVAAYNSSPEPWTSANGTVVTDLPVLESGSHRRSAPTSAAPGPVSSLDVYAVPNPFVFGDERRSFGRDDPYQIEFRNLPERATIRIYAVSGDLIRTIEHGPDARGNLFGSAKWDQKSDSGLLVAPGLYIYHVNSRTDDVSGQFSGKLMIVR
ncbi:MAG: hypothetical protein ACOCTG_00840 [Bacteroidota bacterium]